MSQYAKNSGAVFSLKYHLVWCPKYRRPVLVGAIEKRLREVIEDVRAEHEWTIHALEVMPSVTACASTSQQPSTPSAVVVPCPAPPPMPSVSEQQPSKPYLQTWKEQVQTWQERLTPMPQTH